MSTPEIIYLIPGEDIEGYPGMAWCESSAPSDHCDPEEAVKYVRADIHESALKRQGNAAKMGMDAAKKDASWREENARRLLAESNPAALESERAMNAELTDEVERLRARVVEKCDAPVGWIAPYKYKAACESKMEFFKTIKELREQNEKLQARVAELEAEEEGAKEAFGVIVDKMKDLRSRNLQIEKTIHRQVIEISRLYRSGARPLSNEAAKAGGDV